MQLISGMATWNRSISMRALRAFCAAAERESFREAAAELYLTASAVSHQIKHLETELANDLFIRAARGLSLTESGQALFDDLRPILESLDAVIERHSNLPARDSLRISVKPFFASEVLMPRLTEFSKMHPGLNIDVDTSGENVQNSDASIRLHSSPPASKNSDRLFSVRLIPVSSLDFYDSIKIKAGRVVSDFPIIVHDSRPGAWGQWQRSSRIKLPSDSKTIRLDSMIAVARAAEQGLGAALIPAHLLNRWLESQALVPLFDHELQTKDAYYFSCHASTEENDALSAFRDWVLQELVFEG
jgi:LysR family glycine cleavage system transcriptional activator